MWVVIIHQIIYLFQDYFIGELSCYGITRNKFKFSIYFFTWVIIVRTRVYIRSYLSSFFGQFDVSQLWYFKLTAYISCLMSNRRTWNTILFQYFLSSFIRFTDKLRCKLFPCVGIIHRFVLIANYNYSKEQRHVLSFAVFYRWNSMLQ